MTRNQINRAIAALIDQAGKHVQNAQESTSFAAQSTWTAHITASMVLTSLIEALVAVRDAADEEYYGTPKKSE